VSDSSASDQRKEGSQSLRTGNDNS
jgi:hypothetical protein